MLGGSVVNETLVSIEDAQGDWSASTVIAAVCLIWYTTVGVISSIGYVQLWRHWSSPQPRASFPSGNIPHVTIIRPVKGLEPRLYDCLASTFRQDYPLEKLHVRFCVSDHDDPALPLLHSLLHDFPSVDAQILIESDDLLLQSPESALGPNPKIRNMSRAYREAVDDIVWIIDCNVWVARGVCGRMVAKLCGEGSNYKTKFVHVLPLVVDIDSSSLADESRDPLLRSSSSTQLRSSNSLPTSTLPSPSSRQAFSIGGGRLEESFLSSSHAKFYTAFQTLLVAPCIIGKSTMFRRSHLNALTDGAGIDHFSENICEDHLIGDLIWKQKVPDELRGEKMAKHALCFGDLAIQPMANMSLIEYWRRRVRWLRVRKFTVTLATLVEPGIESFLCSAYGAYAATTLGWFERVLGIPSTWSAFVGVWFVSAGIWCAVDRILFLKLQAKSAVEVDEDTPDFARGFHGKGAERGFGEWLFAWLGREALAFPIWAWAVYGGTEVEWRGGKFKVGMDMKVHEIGGQQNGVAKARRD